MSARMRVGFVWVVGLAFAGQVLAAEPRTASPRLAYTSKTLVTVPIRISESDRAKIKSVKFYVKTPSTGWTLQETGGPRTEKFNFQAPADGEYWFSFPTEEDNRPAASPDQLVAAIAVVVDTHPPEIAVHPLTVASGQTYIQCIMQDANPEPSSLIAEYEAADGSWKPMPQLSKETPGVYRSADGAPPAKIRVTGKDKAGNVSVQTVALAMPAQSPVAVAPKVDAPPAPAVPVPMVNEPAPVPAMPTPVLPVHPNDTTTPVLPVPANDAPTPAISVPEPRVTEKPPTPIVPVEKPVPVVPEPVAPITSGPLNKQVLNTTKCSLAYALDNVGTQVVQRVEAYATRDQGKTWQKVAEDADRTSPIDLNFAEDGLYGVVLVVTTGSQPAALPVAGDAPDWWIEIDTVAPEVKLESTTLGTGDDAGLMMLNWTVRDRNMSPDSVEVSWSQSAEGPWRSIAKGLRSDAQYRWAIPREVGSKCYLKVEATDKAGNVGRFATPQPVSTELSKPKARVLGINPAAARP